MASIERRQVQDSQIDPSLQDVYKQKTIDSIFHRLEGFTDNPSEKYNKEGAIYHFYAGALLSSQWGPISNLIVGWGNHGKQQTDRIKNGAGFVGVDAGLTYWRRSRDESLRANSDAGAYSEFTPF